MKCYHNNTGLNHTIDIPRFITVVFALCCVAGCTENSSVNTHNTVCPAGENCSDSKDEWVNAYYIGLFPFVVSKPDFYVLVTGMDSDNNYEYFEYRNEDKGKFKDKEIYSFVEDSILIRSSNLAKYRINQNGKLSEERNLGYKYLYGVDVGMEWETLREIFEPNDGGAGVSAFDFGYQGNHYGVIIYLTDIDGPERIIRLE